MIDLVLAGDNAIVIGLAAAGLPKELRRKAILIGIVAATVMRIGFALITTQLLQHHRPAARRRPAAALGLLEDVRGAAGSCAPDTVGAVEALSEADVNADGTRRRRRAAQDAAAGGHPDHHRRRLDVARQRAGGGRRGARAPEVLVFGLVLSVALMGIAASSSPGCSTSTAGSPGSAWLVILYVALNMV